MKRNFLPVLLVVVLVLALSLAGSFLSRLPSAHAQDGVPPDEPPGSAYQPSGVAMAVGSDEEPGAALPSGEQAAPDESGSQALAPEAPLPTTAVYFFPQDSDNTSTVLMLLNTNTTAQTVLIQGFADNGTLSTSVADCPSIILPAKSSARVISDPLAANSPSSWANAVSCNFRDASEYGKITLPRGVKADGYVVWGTTTGSYDPRVQYSTLPLRFSIDPLTTFMPTLDK